MENKKKWIGIGIAVLMICLIGSMAMFYYPEEINQSYEGIRFRLGEDEANEDILEAPIVLTIVGTIYPRIFKGDKFIGDIKIGEVNLTDLELQIEASTYLHGQHMTEPFTRYTILYTKDIRKSFVVTELKNNEEGSGGHWSSTDGVVIAAPASNREEGLALMNELWVGSDYTFQ